MPNTAAKQSVGKDANVFMLIAKRQTEMERKERSGERSVMWGIMEKKKRGKRKMEMIKRWFCLWGRCRCVWGKGGSELGWIYALCRSLFSAPEPHTLNNWYLWTFLSLLAASGNLCATFWRMYLIDLPQMALDQEIIWRIKASDLTNQTCTTDPEADLQDQSVRLPLNRDTGWFHTAPLQKQTLWRKWVFMAIVITLSGNRWYFAEAFFYLFVYLFWLILGLGLLTFPVLSLSPHWGPPPCSGLCGMIILYLEIADSV